MEENPYISPEGAEPAKPASTADFHHAQKGRGLWTVFLTAFMAFLATAFLLMAVAGVVHLSSPKAHASTMLTIVVGTVVGLFTLFLTMNGIYAFLKGEAWSFQIHDGILQWSYPRWPKSRGSIDLSTVQRVVVNDGDATLLFTFEDGTSRKIKFWGRGAYLRDYLKESFPDIALEYVEGS